MPFVNSCQRRGTPWVGVRAEYCEGPSHIQRALAEGTRAGDDAAGDSPRSNGLGSPSLGLDRRHALASQLAAELYDEERHASGEVVAGIHECRFRFASQGRMQERCDCVATQGERGKRGRAWIGRKLAEDLLLGIALGRPGGDE